VSNTATAGRSRLNVAPIKSQRLSKLGSQVSIEKGMVLPFQPLCLTFRHMDYYVPLPKVCTSPLPTLIATSRSTQMTDIHQIAFRPTFVTQIHLPRVGPPPPLIRTCQDTSDSRRILVHF
jgi:hypothetical protein